MEIPLGQAAGKPIKSVSICQYEDILNVDIEFLDKSMLEIIFSIRFSASSKLLDDKDGDYHVVETIKPARRPK